VEAEGRNEFNCLVRLWYLRSTWTKKQSANVTIDLKALDKQIDTKKKRTAKERNQTEQ
jgi:hypothetical protein